MPSDIVQFNHEVMDAVTHQLPIVAIESTFISHGMPYPDNIITVEEVEQIIRDLGAIPAIIVIYQGKIHIGLSEELIHLFATSSEVIKASKRDLAFVLSKGLMASTTLAATVFCTHLAKLPLFVTGGIGGVYQQSDNFDTSADLIELASTPVTVICSGAKSILDLPKTLEMLETHGVGIIGFGTGEFPAFYSRSSGIVLPRRLDTVEEIARLMHYQHQLQVNNGLMIANPIPNSAEIPDAHLLPFFEQAQKEVGSLHGKAITPFLIQRIAQLTSSQSLLTNSELMKSNARLGAEIVIAYNKLQSNSL